MESLERKSAARPENEAIRNLIEGEPDAVFILVGAMKYSEQKERYESGSFSDVDENSKLSTGVALATGGKDRMLAAAAINEALPDTIVVPMSRTRDLEKPTYAAVTEDELLRKGVPTENIMKEEVSVNTITEFFEAMKMCKEHGWKNAVFVSSNWHLPRVKALFNHIENFVNADNSELVSEFVEAVRSGDMTVQFVGSTDVLTLKSDHYKTLFDKVDQDAGIKARIEKEEQAIAQIANGTYGDKTLTKRIKPEQVQF